MVEYDVIDGEITEGSVEGDLNEAEIASALEDDVVEGEIEVSNVEGEIPLDETVEGITEGVPFQNEIDPTVPAWAKEPEKPVYEYEEITEKPSINGVTLEDDKSFEELGDNSLTNLEILGIFNRVFRRD